MLKDDTDASAFDPPDPDEVYGRYLETCRCLRVEPVPRERARELIAEWSAAMGTGEAMGPITH